MLSSFTTLSAHSNCSFQLAEAARLVGGHWPNARVVVIHSGQLSLHRALYDRRLHAPVRGEALLQQVFSPIQAIQEGEHSGNH